jgi:TRAP-type mannitol/chloroaromatic compound transport system permease small subunit
VNRVVLFIDNISAWAGKTFGWCILILTFAISYEVFSRYMLRAPTEWAFDVSYMLYGALFMMAGAYCLARNAHVRGDFVYRFWSPRSQAYSDLILFFLFFFPGIIALVYAGFGFARLSWILNEHSPFSPRGPPVYPLKMLIPVAGFLMFLQGVAEVMRCIVCIRTGEWPQRLHDVEELEKVALEQATKQQQLADKSAV